MGWWYSHVEAFDVEDKIKTEQTKMRNKIKIIDPSIPHLTLRDLEIGQLFRYKNPSSEDSVYMRIAAGSTNAIHLATGVGYMVQTDASVFKVTSVNIISSIS